MNCPNCGCNVKTGAIPVSEVELPMAVDPRYGGHGQIRFDPNHPANIAYDEALAPGRAEELAELESIVNPRRAAKRGLSPEDEARIREELRNLGKR